VPARAEIGRLRPHCAHPPPTQILRNNLLLLLRCGRRYRSLDLDHRLLTAGRRRSRGGWKFLFRVLLVDGAFINDVGHGFLLCCLHWIKSSLHQPRRIPSSTSSGAGLAYAVAATRARSNHRAAQWEWFGHRSGVGSSRFMTDIASGRRTCASRAPADDAALRKRTFGLESRLHSPRARVTLVPPSRRVLGRTRSAGESRGNGWGKDAQSRCRRGSVADRARGGSGGSIAPGDVAVAQPVLRCPRSSRRATRARLARLQAEHRCPRRTAGPARCRWRRVRGGPRGGGVAVASRSILVTRPVDLRGVLTSLAGWFFSRDVRKSAALLREADRLCS